MRERCRWLLVNLGRSRKARWCSEHDHWSHPWACFTESGEVDCVCGISTSRSRPVPVLTEAVA